MARPGCPFGVLHFAPASPRQLPVARSFFTIGGKRCSQCELFPRQSSQQKKKTSSATSSCSTLACLGRPHQGGRRLLRRGVAALSGPKWLGDLGKAAASKPHHVCAAPWRSSSALVIRWRSTVGRHGNKGLFQPGMAQQAETSLARANLKVLAPGQQAASLLVNLNTRKPRESLLQKQL